MKRIFFIFLSTLLFLTCDLFNPTDRDMLAKIDAEIAWANAAPLSLTVAFPESWGFSPQRGTGRCLDDIRNTTPRSGYSFTVQFDPNPAYGDAEWIAYKTSELPPDNNWYISAAAINNAIKDLTELGDNEISITKIDGGKSRIVIYGREPVTLIPQSEIQPRIIMSDLPRDFTAERVPNKDITITFAAPVNRGTLLFETGRIEITGELADPEMENPPEEFIDGPVHMESYFETPIYDEADYKLTLKSKGVIPYGLIIKVKLGAEIKSPDGHRGLNETIFSYRTIEFEYAISSWRALYNEVNEAIEIYWILPENALAPTINWRSSNGKIDHWSPDPQVPEDAEKTSFKISEPKPDYDKTLSSGFVRYTISLTLEEEPAQIIIWNVPGMELRQNWIGEVDEVTDITLTEISAAEELSELSSVVNTGDKASLNKVYALTNNITVLHHEPIGTFAEPFVGKFYGNGYMITINSIIDTEYTGLFGVLDGTVIRDFTLHCGIVSGTNALYVGGIAGRIRESVSVLSNIRVTGNITANTNTTGAFYVGGVAGWCESNGGKFSRVSFGGTLTAGKHSGTRPVESILFGGGIAGHIEYPLLEECEFEQNGKIKIIRNNDMQDNSYQIRIGGIAGSLQNSNLSPTNYNLKNCVSMGEINITTNAMVRAGGIVGFMQGTSAANRIGLFNCKYEYGTITVNKSSGVAGVALGGVVGHINNWGYIDGCLSNATSIKLTSSGDNVHYGGFVGYAQRTNVIKSHNISPIDYSGGEFRNIFIGGFAGFIYVDDDDENYVKLEDCWSRGNITSKGGGAKNAGGLVGRSGHADIDGGDNRNTIINCYAYGDIYSANNSTGNGQYLFSGGLVGIAVNTNISRSMASGNVTSTQTSSGTIYNYSGGLVGSLDFGSIEDCYALGNVFVFNPENSSSWLRAGGLLGNMGQADPSKQMIIRRCFAKGIVAARSAADSPSQANARTGAGGVFGLIESSNLDRKFISHTAALGDSVTAVNPHSTNFPRAGRVYPNTVNSTTNINNNYAKHSMRTGTHNDYNATHFATTTHTTGTDTGHNAPHGQTVDDSIFYTEHFWKTNMNFNAAPNSPDAWKFDRLAAEGHPRLAWED